MSSPDEIKAAVEGAASTGLPVVVTVSFDTNGRTMMGVTPTQWAQLAHQQVVPLAAYGGNCGVGASELLAALIAARAAAQPGDVVVAKSNCGVPAWVDGQIKYSGTPELMADYARLARDAGARIIGGCCGTTPEHVAAMHAALQGYQPGEPPSLETVVARLGQVSDATLKLGLFGLESSGDAPEDGGRRRRRRAQF